MPDHHHLEIGALVEGVIADEVVRLLEIRRSGDSALVTYERINGERGTAFLNPGFRSWWADESPELAG